MKAKVRLYVEHPLGEQQHLPLTREQAHYLFGVMRMAIGDGVTVFNGRDGEWQTKIAEAGKRGGALVCTEASGPLVLPPDLWLCFAPIKKNRTDFIVEKAVEMGVRRIQPIATDYTNAGRIRRDRMQAQAIEAAEQCGATFVPEVGEMLRLERLLETWPSVRQVMYCDEAASAGALAPGSHDGAPWAILIGPEGGFSPAERAQLRGLPFGHTVRLGPRILRAETAAVAALTLWQTTYGDWI